MLCPKCGHQNLSAAPDCGRCGVIFARIKQPLAALEPDDGLGFEPQPAGGQLRELFLPADGQTSRFAVWGRGLILLGLLIWGSKLMFTSIASNTAGESLLHLVNLPFHEAGHVILRPFGQFISSLGGTLGQLLVPLLCGGVLLLKSRDPFGAAVCTWWFGENLLDIAPYINDARAGALPLLGGNTGHSSPYGFHDWEYLLTETGLLRHDHLLAKLAHGGGSLLMFAAMLGAAYLLALQFKQTVPK